MPKLMIFARPVLCIAILAFLCAPAADAAKQKSPSTQETLASHVAELQKNPGDWGLREKIIRLTQAMDALPAISEEARRHFVIGQVLQKNAKDARGWQLALDEFNAGLLLAPWQTEMYGNVGLLHEQLQHYDQAKSAYNLFLLLNPDEARQSLDRIYAVEATGKLAQVEAVNKPPVVQEVAVTAAATTIEGDWFPESKQELFMKVIRSGNGWRVKKDGKIILNARATASSIKFTITDARSGGAWSYSFSLEPGGRRLIGLQEWKGKESADRRDQRLVLIRLKDVKTRDAGPSQTVQPGEPGPKPGPPGAAPQSPPSGGLKEVPY